MHAQAKFYSIPRNTVWPNYIGYNDFYFLAILAAAQAAIKNPRK